jgi:hypothetical protein
MKRSPPVKPDPQLGLQTLALRHLRFGWWSLLVFLTLGLVLEAFHGFKTPLYLDVSNHTRRLMWTLAHAHGTLLGLVHVAFGASLPYTTVWEPRQRAFASTCLTGAGLLMPLGFFLGGLIIHGGDPSLGIVLVPVGALLLLLAGALTVRALHQASSAAPVPGTSVISGQATPVSR